MNTLNRSLHSGSNGINRKSKTVLVCATGLMGLTLIQAAAQAPAPKLLSAGKFKSLAHPTSGTAAVYETKDGHVLRLTKLSTTVGPETRVYLVEGDDGTKDDLIKGGKFVDVGELKGNKGNQTYVIPTDTDLNRFRSVSIWCRRFAVNFGAAPLKAK